MTDKELRKMPQDELLESYQLATMRLRLNPTLRKREAVLQYEREIRRRIKEKENDRVCI